MNTRIADEVKNYALVSTYKIREYAFDTIYRDGAYHVLVNFRSGVLEDTYYLRHSPSSSEPARFASEAAAAFAILRELERL